MDTLQNLVDAHFNMNETTTLYHLIIDERWQTILFQEKDAVSYLRIYELLCNIPSEKTTEYRIVPFTVKGDKVLWEYYIRSLRSQQWGWRSSKDTEIQLLYGVQEDLIDEMAAILEDEWVWRVFYPSHP